MTEPIEYDSIVVILSGEHAGKAALYDNDEGDLMVLYLDFFFREVPGGRVVFGPAVEVRRKNVRLATEAEADAWRDREAQIIAADLARPPTVAGTRGGAA